MTSVVNSGRVARWAKAVALGLLVVASMLACGGGSNFAGGVGSGGTGLAEGSVTGFGSVMVDGVEYDDSTAAAQQSDASGALRAVSVKLGQRVRVVYSTAAAGSAGAAVQSLQVLPQLTGPVTMGLDKNGWMQVMGQWVRVVRTGDDISRLGPTVLSGYDSTAGISLADDVQVHGDWIYDSSKAATVLVASLVDKASRSVDPVQLGGVVQALTIGGFRLNAPSGTVVLSSSLPADLTSGQVVQVWASRAAVTAALANGTAVPAARVAVTTLSASDLTGQQQVSVSGLATAYDPATRTVEVQGVRVKLDASVKVDESALARGEFVSLQLVAPKPGASTGGVALVASDVAVRSAGGGTAADLGATTELKGAVSGVNWAGSAVRFVVRGTPVDASATTIDASCRNVGLVSPVNVVVKGALLAAGSVVTASKVTCSVSVSSGARP